MYIYFNIYIRSKDLNYQENETLNRTTKDVTVTAKVTIKTFIAMEKHIKKSTHASRSLWINDAITKKLNC